MIVDVVCRRIGRRLLAARPSLRTPLGPYSRLLRTCKIKIGSLTYLRRMFALVRGAPPGTVSVRFGMFFVHCPGGNIARVTGAVRHTIGSEDERYRAVKHKDTSVKLVCMRLKMPVWFDFAFPNKSPRPHRGCRPRRVASQALLARLEKFLRMSPPGTPFDFFQSSCQQKH